MEGYFYPNQNRHFMRQIIFILVIMILSCGQNNTKQKELELKEKELELRELELNTKEKKDSTQTTSSTVTNIPIFKNPTLLSLPTTIKSINDFVGQKYSTFTKCDTEDYFDNFCPYYEWVLQSGIEILAYSETDINNTKENTNYRVTTIRLSTKNGNIVEDCVYNLALNKTTLQDCKIQFGNQLKKSNYESSYKIYKDKIWTYLKFKNGILVEIERTPFEYDMTG